MKNDAKLEGPAKNGCAEHVRLVELLYQQALSDLENAQRMWRIEEKHKEAVYLAVHADLIFKELHNAVNPRDGGDIATNLFHLYDFMRNHLMEAIIGPQELASHKIGEVIGLLRPLSEAWTTMARQQLGAYAEAPVETMVA
jgi:flagellar biosynthetic protein FliS